MTGRRAVAAAWCAAMAAGAALAGPQEFGLAQFEAALQSRAMRPGHIRPRCELSDGPAESWRIEGARISGGDLRGLLYGILEAAAQVRSNGWLSQARGSAAIGMRGVRFVWEGAVRDAGEAEWHEFLQQLALSRINRLQLVVPDVEANLEAVRRVSTWCSNYAIDFTLGLPESPPEGLPIYERLKQVMAACPLVRSVHLRVTGEPDAVFYRDRVMRAVEEAGRLVTIEFSKPPVGWTGRMRLSRAWDDAQGALPAAAPEEYFELPSPLARGAPVWADPMWARYINGMVERSGAAGFEIEAPWPWRPHRAFFLVWGRTGYNPRIADKALIADFARDAGKTQAEAAYRAWSTASRAFSLAALVSPLAHWRVPEHEAERLSREGSARFTAADLAGVVQEALDQAEQALNRLPADGGDRLPLRALMDAARQRTANAPAAAALKRLPKPTLQHFPPKSAPANIAFPLGLLISPTTHAHAVRLHYRAAGDGDSFHTLESPASRAWFQIKAARDLTYYFEIVSRDGKGWFYPDPLAGPPFLHLPVRPRRAEPPVDPKTAPPS